MSSNLLENKTLSILKPDAIKRNITGKVNSMIEDAGFSIVAQKRILLTKKQAENFYDIHKERPFFRELVESMINDYVVVQVLEKSNAVDDYRLLMGATNPKEAEAGTIRASYALNIGENTVHGSDSNDNAKREISFFFSMIELL